MSIDEEGGSFVDPKESSPRPAPKDSNYRLWELLEQIRDAIKENSVAINNLVSTAFMNRSNVNTTQSFIPTTMPEPINPLTKDQPLPQKTDPTVKVESMFPNDIANMLDFKFDVENKVVIIKPRQFLGSDVFAKVASVVRGANGEYVSAGKGSHFKVPV